MFNIIEVPLIIPILGVIIFLIFAVILINISRKIDKLIKGDFKTNNTINPQNVKINNIEETHNENYILSPMVGIVYLAPEPAKPQFVKEGDHIKQGDTVAIIEAMKTYSNVRATKSGVIKNIFIKNGTPVEYGEKLFSIE